MKFRLSPGITGGQWHHDTVTNVATIALTFAGIETPVSLAITGDVPAHLAGKSAGIFGYGELPDDEQATGDPLEAATTVADFVAYLTANSSGIAPKYELDDDRGVRVTWCSVITRQPVGHVVFCVNHRRASVGVA